MKCMICDETSGGLGSHSCESCRVSQSCRNNFLPGGELTSSSTDSQPSSGEGPATEPPHLSPIISNLISNMVPVKGGTFTLGATPEQEDDCYEDEKPAHEVTVSSFSIGRYVVTQEEWATVMGSNTSVSMDGRRPAVNVSWEDCQEFVSRLNEMTGMKFRLPTEAEWEFAARGGNKSRGFRYSGSDNPDKVAWYYGNSGEERLDEDGWGADRWKENRCEPHPVGQKSPNELGLYDMSGNVWEWCGDCYGDYSSSSQQNPEGPELGTSRVRRGGCWYYVARNCRVSFRFCHNPVGRYGDNGFRLAL